jgi:hypothetical protein
MDKDAVIPVLVATVVEEVLAKAVAATTTMETSKAMRITHMDGAPQQGDDNDVNAGQGAKEPMQTLAKEPMSMLAKEPARISMKLNTAILT